LINWLNNRLTDAQGIRIMPTVLPSSHLMLVAFETFHAKRLDAAARAVPCPFAGSLTQEVSTGSCQVQAGVHQSINQPINRIRKSMNQSIH
jgi:hypothetical protein